MFSPLRKMEKQENSSCAENVKMSAAIRRESFSSPEMTVDLAKCRFFAVCAWMYVLKGDWFRIKPWKWSLNVKNKKGGMVMLTEERNRNWSDLHRKWYRHKVTAVRKKMLSKRCRHFAKSMANVETFTDVYGNCILSYKRKQTGSESFIWWSYGYGSGP